MTGSSSPAGSCAGEGDLSARHPAALSFGSIAFASARVFRQSRWVESVGAWVMFLSRSMKRKLNLE